MSDTRPHPLKAKRMTEKKPCISKGLEAQDIQREEIRQRLQRILADLDELDEKLAAIHVVSALDYLDKPRHRKPQEISGQASEPSVLPWQIRDLKQ